ncbi:hypothetical protein BTVI_75688 [Pitangus sulphuratus]|nr:hypothetical protein BTVI_75688 [Pitangus sulphuratus]
MPAGSRMDFLLLAKAEPIRSDSNTSVTTYLRTESCCAEEFQPGKSRVGTWEQQRKTPSFEMEPCSGMIPACIPTSHGFGKENKRAHIPGENRTYSLKFPQSPGIISHFVTVLDMHRNGAVARTVVRTFVRDGKRENRGVE